MTSVGAGAPDTYLVVAALLVREGHVLLCHRSPRRAWYPDVWDLPGGHVVTGETPTKALVRELHEELGIVVAEPYGEEQARITSDEFDMKVWVVEAWRGEIVNAAPDEHDEVSWFAGDQLRSLRLAHERYLALLSDALGGTD